MAGGYIGKLLFVNLATGTIKEETPEDIQRRLTRIRKSLGEMVPEKPIPKVRPVKAFVPPKPVPKPLQPEIKVDHKIKPKDVKELKTKLSKNLKDIEKLLK